jgi:tRNA threonylcarbamoyladenosine biosynthesis protein TsaE
LQILLQKYELKDLNQLTLSLSSTQCCKYREYLCLVKTEFTLDKIKPAAAKLLETIGNKKILAFHGKMGAGKTTFIHALCDEKGVAGVVSSPTFSIINEYVYSENGVEKKIFHIDLYRLKNEDEAIRAGVEDCFYSNHICFVEWPEIASAIFPEETVHVYIDLVDDNTRSLKIYNY